MSHIRDEYTKPLIRKGSAVQKYKLLKDLPGIKAGTVIEQQPDGEFNSDIDGSWYTFTDKILLNTIYDPDWFAPLDEPASPAGRWRASRSETYYSVDTQWLYPNNFMIFTQIGDGRKEADDKRYELGNYFRTKQQAEAAAEAIRAVLGYIHDPDSKKLARSRLISTDLLEACMAAVETVQADNLTRKRG